MKNTTEHTPWTFEQVGDENLYNIQDDTGCYVTQVVGKECARFIVLACNHFEEMRRAMKQVQAQYDNDAETYWETMRLIDDLLARIEADG